MTKSLLYIALALIMTCSAMWWMSASSLPTADSSAKMERYFGKQHDGQPKPDRPGDAADFWAARLRTPNGENPAKLNYQIKRDLEIRRSKSAEEPPPAFRFEDFGPGNFGGRVRAIVVHPQDPDILLTGSVSGGVWKTIDGGLSWTAQSDFMANLAIGCMVNDPDNPEVVFAGTGEGFFNGDQMRGLGIFKSTDFGETWTQLPATVGPEFYYVNRLDRIPNSNVLLAATRNGVFRSDDLGESFQKVTDIVTTGRGFVDLKVDPSDPDRIYAYHYGAGGADTPTNTITVNAPEDLAGEYQATGAQFGPLILDVGPITGDVVLVEDSQGGGSIACSPLANAAALSGNIALIDRGECAFVDKVSRAQSAGAVAVIVVNNTAGNPIVMGGDGPGITIPSIMVDQFTGTLFKDFVDQGVNVTLTSTLQNERFLTVSRDGGFTFEALGSAQGLPVTNISRMEIGIGTDGVVYVSVADASQNPATRGLWRSRDGGQNFLKTASDTQYIERQGWYDLMIGVDPTDSNRVYLGAIDVFRTLDAGTTISQVSTWAPRAGQIPMYVHADVHAIAFHPFDPQTIWIGTDGGVFKSTNGGSTFTTLNRDLRIAQNYGIAVHPDGSQVIAGTQDNGSHIFYGDKKIWLEWAGGDGGFCAWDQQNPDYIYGSNPYGDVFGSPNGGSVLSYFDLPDTDGALFIQPIALDPNNGNRMVVGTDNIFFTHNARNLAGAQWEAATPSLGGSVSALVISPHDSTVAFAGNTQGRVFRITNLGGVADAHRFSGLPTGETVTWIEVDTHDTTNNTFYVTFADYETDRVFKTTDGGNTFTSIHGNLPSIPVHCVTVDPRDGNRIFVGTELGLWVSQDNQGDGPYVWTQYDYGTAWTRVVQMAWGGQDALWVGTHGRGMFRMTRHPVELDTSLQELEGDGDGFIDLYERHNFLVHVRNTTGQPLDSLRVALSVDDPSLEIHSATQTRATLQGFETWIVPFELVLDELDGPLTLATLTPTVTWTGGSQTDDVPLILGAQDNINSDAFIEDAEDAATLMQSNAILDEDDWQRVTTQAHSGSYAWFSADIDGFADKSLETPWLTVTENGAQLTFWIFYDMEGDMQQYWDGTVLEAKTADGDWHDVGGRITDVPYDGQLFSNTSLQFRQAWSGRQRTWRQASLNLSSYLDQEIKLRFRVGCDQAASVPGGGVWIDDVTVSGVSWEQPPTADDAACTSCSRVKGSDLPFHAYLAHTPTLGDLSSVIGITNPSDQTVNVEVFAFSADGQVRGVIQTTLNGYGMIWESTENWFPQSAAAIAWLDVASDAEVMVFAEMQAPDVGSAYQASQSLTLDVTLPHVAKNTGLFETYLATVNGIPQDLQTELVPSAASSVPLVEQHEPYQQLLNTAVGVLGESIADVDWGLIRAQEAGLAAMEFFTVLPQETQVASLGLNQDRGTLLRFLHIAKDTDLFWTGMVYFNTTELPATAVETYFSDSGDVLDTRNVELAPFEKVTLLFDHTTTEGPVPQGAAWLQVEADQVMVGYELFGASFASNHDFFAGLQGSYRSGTNLAYPFVKKGPDGWTGLVALNVGTETADLALTLMSADGTALESAVIEGVAPNTKSTVLVSSLFSETALSDGAWVRATASGSLWTGFALWGDQSGAIRQTLSGLKAHVE